MLRYLKYFWYVLLAASFAATIFYYIRSSDLERKQSKEYLNNNIEFEGYVTGFERSDNHAFGVLYLIISKSNVREFSKELQKGIYPYKINGNKAELYCTVSNERKKGDFVKVISNQETIYYNPPNSEEEGSLFIIIDPYNIDFVKEHTIFK